MYVLIVCACMYVDRSMMVYVLNGYMCRRVYVHMCVKIQNVSVYSTRSACACFFLDPRADMLDRHANVRVYLHNAYGICSCICTMCLLLFV